LTVDQCVAVLWLHSLALTVPNLKLSWAPNSALHQKVIDNYANSVKMFTKEGQERSAEHLDLDLAHLLLEVREAKYFTGPLDGQLVHRSAVALAKSFIRH
jgi:hypothetical protein